MFSRDHGAAHGGDEVGTGAPAILVGRKRRVGEDADGAVGGCERVVDAGGSGRSS